ncbi:MAG: hypothetical protein NC102_00180 [Clostridium sp.]|nr:hypothetical protein [Clostridium sp.]
MRHGKFLYRLFVPAVLAVCWMLCVLGLFGCRSYRAAFKEQKTGEARTVRTDERRDSCGAFSHSASTEADTAMRNARTAIRIDIARDSCGRPVRIDLQAEEGMREIVKRNAECSQETASHRDERLLQATDSLDTFCEEKEEAAQEVDPGIPIEKVIGPALLGLAIFYIVFILAINGLKLWRQKEK